MVSFRGKRSQAIKRRAVSRIRRRKTAKMFNNRPIARPPIPSYIKRSQRRFTKRSFKSKAPSYGSQAVFLTKAPLLALPSPPTTTATGPYGPFRLSRAAVDLPLRKTFDAAYNRLTDSKMTTAIRQYASTIQPPSLLDRLSGQFINLFGSRPADSRVQVDNRRRRR